MASPFLPTTHYPGSARGASDIYPVTWNATTRRTESKRPGFQGTAPLPPIFSGISQQPVIATQAAPATVAAGSIGGASPVYPLNVPTGAGVSTIVVPKSQNVANAASGMFADLNAFKESQNKVLSDFRARFPEWFADQQKTAGVENAATSRLFSGDVQAQSDANVANFLAQANAANAKSIADVQRLTSRSALASDASGYSSARDRGRFATIANINAGAGRDAAVAKMQADQWLTQLQQQMAGAQAARNRASLADVMLPAQAETNIFENILRQLSTLTPIEQSNLLAGIVGPGGYVGDTFGQLQSFKLSDLSRLSNERQAADASALNWSNFARQNQAMNAAAQAPATGGGNWYDGMLT